MNADRERGLQKRWRIGRSACESARRLFVPFLDGEASEREADEVRSHVEACERCARELSRERDLGEALAGAFSVPAESGLTGRAVREAARLEAGGASARARRGSAHRRPLRWALPAAAAALVALGLFVVFRRDGPPGAVEPVPSEDFLAHLDVLEALEEEGLEPTPELVRVVLEAAGGLGDLEKELLESGIFDVLLEEELGTESL